MKGVVFEPQISSVRSDHSILYLASIFVSVKINYITTKPVFFLIMVAKMAMTFRYVYGVKFGNRFWSCRSDHSILYLATIFVSSKINYITTKPVFFLVKVAKMSMAFRYVCGVKFGNRF